MREKRVPLSWLAASALALLLAGCGGSGPAFQLARAEETPAAYREFLFRNPNHPKAAEVRALLDDADYTHSEQLHTAPAYLDYLEKHPTGKHFRKARHWAERLSYYDAISRKDSAFLKDFLKRFPGGQFASDAETKFQRALYRELRKKESIEVYRRFLARYKNAPSEVTAEATQRLERLLLDEAKIAPGELLLARFIHDNPGSPYLPEARRTLRRQRFERVIVSHAESDWKAFLRTYPGTKEAAAVAKHMEEEALRAAERSGRISALERYLKRYPNSPHKSRILTSISLSTRERNRQAHRWVRVREVEVEAYRPRKCAACKPVLRVIGTLENTDPDFAYNLSLEAELVRGKTRCCKTRREVKALRPGESRQFTVPIPGEPSTEPLPGFSVRVVEGKAFRNPSHAQRLEVPELGSKAGPADRFNPKAAPPLPALPK